MASLIDVLPVRPASSPRARLPVDRSRPELCSDCIARPSAWPSLGEMNGCVRASTYSESATGLRPRRVGLEIGAVGGRGAGVQVLLARALERHEVLPRRAGSQPRRRLAGAARTASPCPRSSWRPDRDSRSLSPICDARGFCWPRADCDASRCAGDVSTRAGRRIRRAPSCSCGVSSCLASWRASSASFSDSFAASSCRSASCCARSSFDFPSFESRAPSCSRLSASWRSFNSSARFASAWSCSSFRSCLSRSIVRSSC